MRKPDPSGPVEQAIGQRGVQSYPGRWGQPQGERFSETRARWVRNHVRIEELRSVTDPEAARRRLARSQDEQLAALRATVDDLKARHGRR